VAQSPETLHVVRQRPVAGLHRYEPHDTVPLSTQVPRPLHWSAGWDEPPPVPQLAAAHTVPDG
jgi:hypothetical protein